MNNKWVSTKTKSLLPFKTRREVYLKIESMGTVPFIESCGPEHMPDNEMAGAFNDLRSAYFKFMKLLPSEYTFSEAPTQVSYTSPPSKSFSSSIDLYKTDPSDIDDI